MLSIRISWIKTLWVLLIVSLCFSFSYTSAVTTTETSLFESLQTSTDTQKGSPRLKIFIDAYCSSVLNHPGFTWNTFTYNAKYSAFVYLLCSNMDDNYVNYSELKTDYFKISTFADLWFKDFWLSTWLDLCNPGYMNNDCDLSSNVPMLFNGIMEDYINIKQSFLYGALFPYSSQSELRDLINTQYSQPFFGVDICDNPDHPYTKTCNMVESSIKNIRNIMTEVRIFDTEKILAMKALDEEPTCDQQAPSRNVFYCWLKDTELSMTQFINLIYNELYYYRLFVGYYMIILQKYPGINSDYATILQNFSSEYAWSKSAISLSLRMMRDMYMAFPFHVWLSMYQEDVDAFSTTLANIATPMYTLYDKLRNVQKPD